MLKQLHYTVRFIQKMIERSVVFRVLLAILFAYIVLLALKWIEYVATSLVCEEGTSIRCFIKELLSILNTGNIEGFSILLVALLYIIENRQRKRKLHYETWQVIDAASGVETSYARFQAMQDLNKDGVSMRSIDVPDGDLENINLQGADLEFADLRGTNLRNANLSNANLRNARLDISPNHKKTNLENANLQGANLQGANISGANLHNANLQQARLHNTIIESEGERAILPTKWEKVWIIVNETKSIRSLRRNDLSNADLSSVDFTGIDLRQANMQGCNLSNSNLSRSRIIALNLLDANLSGAILPRTYSKSDQVKRNDIFNVGKKIASYLKS